MNQMHEFLDKNGLDSYLFIGDSVCDLDMYYISHFLARDRFTILAQEDIYLLVSGMEFGRAKRESIAHVENTSDFGYFDKLSSLEDPNQTYLAILKEFLRDHSAKRLGISGHFPAGIYSELSREFQLNIIESPATKWRSIKTEIEIANIHNVQMACDKAMKLAIRMISHSTPKGGYLYTNGKKLTSESVRTFIDITLRKMECEAIDTFVVGGSQGADPHARGDGPLPSDQPIVIDIYPYSWTNRYFSDMSRTVVRGEASTEVKEIYDAVLDAQISAIKAVRKGISGKEVHSQVCQVFRDHGYPDRAGKGFMHSTGHGVGLNSHERPYLNEAGEVLQTNNVITVEPGLYYPHVGGVRLEDLVVVKKNGCDNLTHFERRLVV